MRFPALLLLLLIPCLSFAQKQGQALTDSFLRELSHAGQDTERVKILDQLSFDYADIDPDIGIQYGNQSLQLAQKLHWKKGIARAHADLGINYAAKSQYATALEYYQQAMAYSKVLNDQSSVAGNMVNIGNVYLSQTNYGQALEFFFQGLSIYEELDDKSNIAAAYDNIGIIYLEQKNYLKALEYYNKSLQIYTETGSQKGVARALGNVGIVYDARGNYNDALDHHWKALTINESLDNKNGQQLNLANIGYVYTHLKDYPQALQYLFKALKISEQLGSKASIAINLGNIGETYFAMSGATVTDGYTAQLLQDDAPKNLSEAITYLEKSIAICKEIDLYAPLIEFNQYRSEAYLLTGNTTKAYDVLKENNHIKDSVFSIEKEIQIANLESAKEIMLKNKDLELKNKQLLIYKLDNARKQNERLLYIFTTIFLLAAAGVSVKLLYNYRHSNRILSREKEDTVHLLKTSQANFKTVFDNTDTAYILADAGMKIISFNEPARRNVREIQHTGLREGLPIIDYIPQDRRDMVLRQLQHVLAGEMVQYEIMEGEPGKMRWYFVRYFPVRDEHRNIHGIIVEINDVTERKTAEQQTLQLVDTLQKKNRDLSQFAYIISHNLRAPIAKIMGLASLLADDDNDREEEKMLIGYIADEVHHLDDVIGDLNTIISVRDTEQTIREQINIEDKLKLVSDALQTDIQESSAAIETDLRVKNIVAIKGYLYSILYNLLSNSIKYRNPAVPLQIHIRTQEENDYIRLTVADNGLGIDLSRNREKLFGLYKRFHSTDIPGKGIGLYLVKTQVEALKGWLEVDSGINNGTVFNIYLPKA